MRRMQITLPDKLVEEISKATAPRKRSRFVAEALEEKLARLKFAKDLKIIFLERQDVTLLAKKRELLKWL